MAQLCQRYLIIEINTKLDLNNQKYSIQKSINMVALTGLEPATFRLSGERSNHLNYNAIYHFIKHYSKYSIKWRFLRDSNSPPTA